MQLNFMLLMVVLLFIGMAPMVYAEYVPSWVKNTAGWWATDAISETEFVNAIEYLVKTGIIQVSSSESTESSQGVPDWVKNNDSWVKARISTDSDFDYFNMGYLTKELHQCEVIS